MTTPDQNPVASLVTVHTPLVWYAVTELAARLPHGTSLEPLVAAGLHGLRSAAQQHDGRTAEFPADARRHIAAALRDVVTATHRAGTTAAFVGEPGTAAAVEALPEPALDAAALLQRAHASAFTVEAAAPRRGAAHYATVAAVSDYHGHLDAMPSQTHEVLERKSGA